MSDDGENKPAQQRGLLPPWQPGQSGNPAGRPKGSRNKLAEAFIAAVLEDFERDGAPAIVKVRENEPAKYLQVVAGLVPKEFKIEQSNDIDEDELNRRLRALAQFIGSEIGTVEPAGTEKAPARAKQAGKLPPVH